MAHTRPIVRVIGAWCIAGAGVIAIGTYLTWYHVPIAGRVGRPSTFDVDLYRLSVDRFDVVYNIWSASAIDVGVAGLAIIGSGLALGRRLPLVWASLWIAVAVGLVTHGGPRHRTPRHR